jgi:hypothetical protein
LALAAPTVESLVLELVFLESSEFCAMDYSETETENKETEKEEKDEKEKELYQLLRWLTIADSQAMMILVFDSVHYESLTYDIPSPPPDRFS